MIQTAAQLDYKEMQNTGDSVYSLEVPTSLNVYVLAVHVCFQLMHLICSPVIEPLAAASKQDEQLFVVCLWRGMVLGCLSTRNITYPPFQPLPPIFM